jgi:hypothetical protein
MRLSYKYSAGFAPNNPGGMSESSAAYHARRSRRRATFRQFCSLSLHRIDAEDRFRLGISRKYPSGQRYIGESE